MPSSHLAIEIFCAYAPMDEKWRRQLDAHLSALKRQGLISLWHDQHILPGSNWTEAIDAHLETASIILLLISADFISSDYCEGIEMKRALERHEANEARVIPIVVRPCDWQQLPIGKLLALPMDAKPISLWKPVDEGWKQVTTGLRRMIEDLSLLPASVPRETLPKIWMIPYPRNPFFLGRNELLSQLHIQLQAGQVTALSQAQAISGLGGIGKTQIAVEYAYRYAHEYQMVLWARADDIESLNSSYVRLATELNLPEKEAQEQGIITVAVKTWLQSHRAWLFILDNADELTLLRDFLPPVLGGHLLITTRASATGRLAQRIEVEPFAEEQGALFLLRRASMLAHDAPLAQTSTHVQMTARDISRELGGLPLALDQAGAYLEETGCSLMKYQQIYQQHQEALLKNRRGLVNDYPQPIATAWSLSFVRVEQKDRVAANVLWLCAFLSADAIPVDIMVKGSPEQEPVAPNDYLLLQAIETLRAYSLVKYDPVTETLSIHRLVQVVLRDALSIEERNKWMQQAVMVMDAAFPPVKFAFWQQCERYLPHALVCANWIEEGKLASLQAVRLLRRTAYYLSKHARYAEAELLYQRVLSIREQQLGTEHSDTADGLNDLAYVYNAQGKYTEAKSLYQQALSIREKQLGAEHPDVAQSLNNLAYIYNAQGEYTKAELLYQQALSIREKQLGAEHPRVARSLNNLAAFYREQGKYVEAELLFIRALSIREKQLGAEHPAVANSLNGLATLYSRQGNNAKAEPLYQRALQIRKLHLGLDHPRTQVVRSNYLSLLRDMGRDEEARKLEEDS